jgi:hypothetical protein
MHQIRPAIALTFLLAARFLNAQTTWNGLRFRMTESEVKQALKSRAVRPSARVKTENETKEYVGWEVHDLELEQMRGFAIILFDAVSHRLSGVVVYVKDPDMDVHALAFPDEDEHASIFAMRLQSLRDEISKKYGHPFLHSCPTLQSCKTTWRDKQQIVDMDIMAGSVLIHYRLRDSTPDL